MPWTDTPDGPTFIQPQHIAPDGGPMAGFVDREAEREAKRSSRANDVWKGQVHKLMRQGFGFDDIAVKLGCPAAYVRVEADILRAEGKLDGMYRRG